MENNILYGLILSLRNSYRESVGQLLVEYNISQESLNPHLSAVLFLYFIVFLLLSILRALEQNY